MLETLIRNWWAVALRGLVVLLFGISCLVWPGLSLVILVALFAGFAMVSGLFALVAGIRAASRNQRWGQLVFQGVVGIAAGLVTLFWPAITALALLFVIGAWAIVNGVTEIAAAIRLRRDITGEWMLALSGALSIVLGILLFSRPAAGALAVVWLIGIYSLFTGFLLGGLGLRLRSFGLRRRVTA